MDIQEIAGSLGKGKENIKTMEEQLSACIDRHKFTNVEAAALIGCKPPSVTQWRKGYNCIGKRYVEGVQAFLDRLDWSGWCGSAIAFTWLTDKDLADLLPPVKKPVKKVNGERVTPENSPELSWESPPSTWLPHKVVQSDAFRVLSGQQAHILLWVIACRQYPGRKKRGKRKLNYYKPINADNVKLTYRALCVYFQKQQRSKMKPPSIATYYRTMGLIMSVGFLSCVYFGGGGPGDTSTYRYENNWRTWRKGDPSCFNRECGSRNNIFCRNANGKFV